MRACDAQGDGRMAEAGVALLGCNPFSFWVAATGWQTAAVDAPTRIFSIRPAVSPTQAASEG